MTPPDDEPVLFGPARWRFSPGVADEGRALLRTPPAALYHRLAADKESQAVRWAARALIDATLDLASADSDTADAEIFDRLASELQTQRDTLRQQLGEPAGRSNAVQRALLRERAPVRTLSGVWLEGVSQPATQPSALVNRLFRARVADQLGNTREKPQWLRHDAALAEAGIALPGVQQSEFIAACDAAPASWMLGAFYSAMALYGASSQPEVIALQWAHHALGLDVSIAESDDAPYAREEAAACARDALHTFATVAGGAKLRERLVRAVRVCMRLEALQCEALLERVRGQQHDSIDERVAQILLKHAPFAGRQHGAVRVGGRLLAEQLDAPEFEPHAFMRSLRGSPYLQPPPHGQACRFIAALEFGGPMFGVFDDEEVSTLRAWAQGTPAADPAARVDTRPVASLWERIVAAALAQAQFEEQHLSSQPRPGARELFHMLVNIERFPCVLPLALDLARDGLQRATKLLQAPGDGSRTRYTDARFFVYSRPALEQRLNAIYRDKLVQPYAPLASVPCADEVVFQQKTFALGNLIDGAWAHRSALRGRHRRGADAALFKIYADEMGGGDLEKNHIALIYRVLRSMAVSLPHIASTTFIEQEELLDELYPFAIFQLSLALFPDTLRSEILGFNLGIEMFGLGELRLHEIQKLRHWGFDAAYEVTHLSIDNFGSGHARSSFEAVAEHLEHTTQTFDSQTQQREWERVWTGYASFSQFIERPEVLPTELSDYVI